MANKFKSEIAPKGLEFRAGDIVIGDKYCCLMTVVSYPKSIYSGYLSNITQLGGVKLLIKHIPVSFQILQKMLNKEVAELDERLAHEKDITVQEKIRQDRESLDQFVTMLAATQARIFDFQLHLLLTADNMDDLERKKMQVRNYVDSMGMRAVVLRFEQQKILESALPLFPNNDIEKRVGIPIPSATIAAMYPFIFDSIKDPGLSCLLGVDFSGGIILFNQFLYQVKKEFNRNNANMIILGTSGSGKSVTAKLLLRSNIRNGHKVIVIDPEGELEDMAKLYGGDFISLGKGGAFGMINPLEIIMDADEEDIQAGVAYSVITRTLQNIKAFLKYYSPDIEEDTLNMFSEMLQDTYKRFRIDENADLTTFTPEMYPTFDDVYKTVEGRLRAITEQTREREVLEKLELKLRPLIKELRYYFTGHTTIVPDSDFIVFNIREVMNSESNIRNALFFNILKYAWGLTLDKEVNTVLMVDEAHVLLADKNTLGAEFLAQVQRRSRKYNTGTIIITQQPTDFASPEVIVHGKAIFDNASYYMVMGLRKQAVEDLAKLIDLNEQEKDAIKRFNQGEALFVCGARRMKINVVATAQELDSFGSGGGL